MKGEKYALISVKHPFYKYQNGRTISCGSTARPISAAASSAPYFRTGRRTPGRRWYE